MRRTFILLTMLLLTGCAANEYNQIRFKAGVTVPLPIMPIDIGVTLEFKDALEESLTDEEIFQRLVDDATLDRLLNASEPLPDDGVRSDSPSEGVGDGRSEDDRSSGRKGKSGVTGGGEDSGANR